jgi:putative glutamine amidotransferase
MPRPRIGITTSFEDKTQRVSHYYIRAIEAAGGLPLIVPILDSAEAVSEFAALLDGLLITGGPAITEGMIGDLPTDLNDTDPARVRSDRMIFEAFSNRPVLGICYGMQFINARAGGTIYADLMAQQAGTQPHSTGRGGTQHDIRLEAGSHLRDVFGKDRLEVNTYHIQAVAEVGKGLRAVAYSPDGVVEAIESEDGRLLGVQFHPEHMLDVTLPLFKDFVDRCRHA